MLWIADAVLHASAFLFFNSLSLQSFVTSLWFFKMALSPLSTSGTCYSEAKSKDNGKHLIHHPFMPNIVRMWGWILTSSIYLLIYWGVFFFLFFMSLIASFFITSMEICVPHPEIVCGVKKTTYVAWGWQLYKCLDVVFIQSGFPKVEKKNHKNVLMQPRPCRFKLFVGKICLILGHLTWVWKLYIVRKPQRNSQEQQAPTCLAISLNGGSQLDLKLFMCSHFLTTFAVVVKEKKSNQP